MGECRRVSERVWQNYRIAQTLPSKRGHLCGHSPVWMLMCFVKLPCRANARAQTSHLNGFSPVCLRRWTVNSCAHEHALLHVPHMYGVTSMWVLECVVKWPCCVNALSHSLHLNGFSPVWIRLCLVKWPALANSLSHTSQTCVLLPPLLRSSRTPSSSVFGTSKQITEEFSLSIRSRSKLSTLSVKSVTCYSSNSLPVRSSSWPSY